MIKVWFVCQVPLIDCVLIRMATAKVVDYIGLRSDCSPDIEQAWVNNWRRSVGV